LEKHQPVCKINNWFVKNNNWLSKTTTDCQKQQLVVKNNNWLSKTTTGCQNQQLIVKNNNWFVKHNLGGAGLIRALNFRNAGRNHLDCVEVYREMTPENVPFMCLDAKN